MCMCTTVILYTGCYTHTHTSQRHCRREGILSTDTGNVYMYSHVRTVLYYVSDNDCPTWVDTCVLKVHNIMNDVIRSFAAPYMFISVSTVASV